ncbi:MAG: hypothetical protein HKN42_07430 [Granulosicoccus sp.]|nr:hypothetical protein [Granulosicoccus sp.]
MEGRASRVHPPYTSIGFDELTSMVAELIAMFELGLVDVRTDSPAQTGYECGWISPDARTQVIRHGSSVAMHSVLQQVPGAVSAEFEVIHDGVKVFSWCEYRWPNLQPGDALRYPSGEIELPVDCLSELLQFHVEHHTAWLARYRAVNRPSTRAGQVKRPGDGSHGRRRSVEVDEIGIVAQADRVHIP